MNKEEFLNNLIFKFEMAEANLLDDIEFIRCMEEEYLVFKNPQESVNYIYWQLQNIIRTLEKSLVYNQKEMQETIDKYYEIIKSEKENNIKAINM